MAVFDLDDPAAEAGLAAVQSLVARHDGLTAFALFGRFADGRLTAAGDLTAARGDLEARARRLELDFPVTLLPRELTPGEALHYRPFTEHFDVSLSGTVFVAAANNRVRFAGQLPPPVGSHRLKRAVEALF